MEPIAIIALALAGIALILIGLRIRKIGRDRKQFSPTRLRPIDRAYRKLSEQPDPAFAEAFDGPYDWGARSTIGQISGSNGHVALVATAPPVQRRLDGPN